MLESNETVAQQLANVYMQQRKGCVRKQRQAALAGARAPAKAAAAGSGNFVEGQSAGHVVAAILYVHAWTRMGFLQLPRRRL